MLKLSKISKIFLGAGLLLAFSGTVAHADSKCDEEYNKAAEKIEREYEKNLVDTETYRIRCLEDAPSTCEKIATEEKYKECTDKCDKAENPAKCKNSKCKRLDPSNCESILKKDCEDDKLEEDEASRLERTRELAYAIAIRDAWSDSKSVQEVPCVGDTEVTPVVVPPEVPSDQFVNYRQTAADYREYGERTPQDQLIVTSGPGSNISAAIPPTIDEEVADYENAVNAAFDEAVNESGANAGNSSGDDAVEDWLAEEGATLKGLLSEWCERAGWRLVWNSNRNYTLAAGAMFRGRFADVASALIRNFARARPAPLATFYKGNRVLVVETKEDENAFN